MTCQLTASLASIPKTVIASAIARGQGQTPAGTQLEALTVEILMPPDMAFMVDVETDNKLRTLAELRNVVKKNGAVVGSTSFYFSKRGRAVFEPGDDAPSLSELLEGAVELDGIEDVEELPGGSFVTWTGPTELMSITKALAKQFDLEVLESDLVWAPNEDTRVAVGSSEDVMRLDGLLSALGEFPEVKATYTNVRRGDISEDDWDRLEKNIDI